MSEITKYNYEAWLLDYVEGNLSNEQEKMVDQFLEENPELKAEFDLFEPVYLQPDPTITFDKKDSLLKEEKKGGRTIYFNFSVGIAAAAAVIIAMIAILPFFWNNVGSSGLTALSEVPEWDGIEVSDQQPTQQPTLPVENQQLANNNNKTEKESESVRHQDTESERKEIVEPNRESIEGLASLSQEGIDEIQSYDEQYYYGQNEVMANFDRTPKELNYVFPDKQPMQQSTTLFNSILNTEVARAFIPEAIEEEMPDNKKNEEKSGPTIYLELPPAGKKIVDRILN